MGKVTPAKPEVGGGIWMDEITAVLPTDAVTPLASSFRSLGFISDAGVARSVKKENTVVKAWGGAVVAVLDNGKTETFKFKMLEADNLDALGLALGEATGTLDSGITAKSGSGQSVPHAFVICMILADDIVQRIVIPKGVVTDVGEIVYKDNEPIGFEITITAIEDSSGYTAYDYMKKVETSATEPVTGATGQTSGEG